MFHCYAVLISDNEEAAYWDDSDMAITVVFPIMVRCVDKWNNKHLRPSNFCIWKSEKNNFQNVEYDVHIRISVFLDK